jgi:hypothetical protein
MALPVPEGIYESLLTQELERRLVATLAAA